MKFPEIKRAKVSERLEDEGYYSYSYSVKKIEIEKKSRAKWAKDIMGWVGGLKYQTGIALEKQVIDIQNELERQAKEDEK